LWRRDVEFSHIASEHIQYKYESMEKLLVSPRLWYAAAAALGSTIAIRRLMKSAGLLHHVDISTRRLRVVVTGGTKGLGRDLARKFAALGDSVMICARSQVDAERVARELAEETGAVVIGASCDVGNAESVEAFAAAAEARLDGIDIWVNNAGCTQTTKGCLTATEPAEVQRVLQTNLFGSFLGARAALATAEASGKMVQVFNVDGAGSSGGPTPGSAAYGASKAAIPQLSLSLAAEASVAGIRAGVHTISPGMVMTDLLLTPENRGNPATLRVFNILADDAPTVAEWLVPRMRAVRTLGPESEYIRYLTGPGVAWRFATARWRANRLITVPHHTEAPRSSPSSGRDTESGGCPVSFGRIVGRLAGLGSGRSRCPFA
jgi:NAD(P)-dependent dehydrogenase (short-subunit alcohol dehydrogenase family)